MDLMIKELRPKLFWIVGDWSDQGLEFIMPISEWMTDNCRGHFVIDEKRMKGSNELIGFHIYIESDDEAIAFKLRWL